MQESFNIFRRSYIAFFRQSIFHCETLSLFLVSLFSCRPTTIITLLYSVRKKTTTEMWDYMSRVLFSPQHVCQKICVFCRQQPERRIEGTRQLHPTRSTMFVLVYAADLSFVSFFSKFVSKLSSAPLFQVMHTRSYLIFHDHAYIMRDFINITWPKIVRMRIPIFSDSFAASNSRWLYSNTSTETSFCLLKWSKSILSKSCWN